MAAVYTKIMVFLLAVLAIVGGMLLTEDQLAPPPPAEDEELVAEREREERPNLYDYNQQELRDQAFKKARRSYWRKQDYTQSDSDIYYYHEQHAPYETYPE